MHHSDICLCRTGRRPESNLSPISLPVVPTSSGDEEDDTLASLSTALNGRLQQDILAFRSTRQLLTLLEASPNMQQVFQTGMDACDALGIQLVWFFLAMGKCRRYSGSTVGFDVYFVQLFSSAHWLCFSALYKILPISSA